MAIEKERLRPATPISPGEILQDELGARGWTQTDFAEIIGKPLQTVNEIIKGKKAITPETAIAFSSALGTSAELWLNLEASYRLDLLDHSTTLDSSAISRKAKLFAFAPVSELIKLKWIPCDKKKGKYTDKHIGQIERGLCKFYDTANLDEVIPVNADYRTSSEYDATHSSLQAWLQKAKKTAAKVKVSKFNRDKLLQTIGTLVENSIEEDVLSGVEKFLSPLGVRIVFVKHLQRTKLDGAAFWLDEKNPVIGLTLRLNRVDNFWFTLMHELAHILYHFEDKQKTIFDESITEPGDSPREKEADSFAQSWLIPEDKLGEFIKERNNYFTAQAVRKFAETLKVHPAIVVGRLQHDGHVPYSYMRNVLEKVY